MTSEQFEYPFLLNSEADICDSDICPSPSPVTDQYCGNSLVNNTEACPPCSFEQDDIVFLGCNVTGFSGKLGFNGSESSVSVDLACSASKYCDPKCDPVADLGCDPDQSQEEDYNGSIGHIYTFNIGSFCFRGILSNHQYVESSSGYRYKVTLTDGRKILSNVAVIMQDSYSYSDLVYPNIINVLYNIEKSVLEDNCGSGNKCRDFGKSGKTNKGILLKKVLEAIDGKPCQLPITKAVLNINLCELLKIVPDEYRISETKSNVLDLVSLACEEGGYDFYVAIVGFDIKVFPVNYKSITYADNAGEPPLFKFLSDISENNIVIDREYGQELTFNKSKKMVIGDNQYYITTVEPSVEPCIVDNPGTTYQSDPKNANSLPDDCDTLP